MPNARTIAFLLAAAISLVAHNSAPADTPPCRSIEYERNAYTVCEVDIRKQTVRLYWKGPDGTPYAYLSALPRAPEGEGGRLLQQALASIGNINLAKAVTQFGVVGRGFTAVASIPAE